MNYYQSQARPYYTPNAYPNTQNGTHQIMYGPQPPLHYYRQGQGQMHQMNHNAQPFYPQGGRRVGDQP